MTTNNLLTAAQVGFVKRAMEYGMTEMEAKAVFQKEAAGGFEDSNTARALESLKNTYTQPAMLANYGGARDAFTQDKLAPWLQSIGQDYGIGAGGTGALAAAGGAGIGGILGKGVGHLAGMIGGGSEDEQKKRQQSWGNTGATVGALGGAGLGGALAGLGGPIAGLWNADRGMSPPPTN